MSESRRIADQLRRAFDGEAWHGPAVVELLAGVDAEKASRHPAKNVHSIWEIVRHINVWDDAAIRRMAGEVVQPTGEADWPKVTDVSSGAWQKTVANLTRTHNTLVKQVEAMEDARLSEQVPGKKEDFYNFYYMLHGIAQHELYHAGQIAILKKLG
jgi:uncharacterized damage-inducible protein DinB